jgi:hypothetical protein
MSDITTNMQQAVAAYAAHRAEKLLKQGSFHVGELNAIIAQEVSAEVMQGITQYTQPLLASGHLEPGRHMRLCLVQSVT